MSGRVLHGYRRGMSEGFAATACFLVWVVVASYDQVMWVNYFYER